MGIRVGIGGAVAAAVAVLGMLAVPATAETAQRVITTDGCVLSVPEPGTTAQVPICFTLFEPVQAQGPAGHAVPLIVHSHGFGATRTTDAADFADFTDAGFGVLSFDQRGFGQSGGHAHFEDPDVEGYDVRALVAYVSRLPWVQQDGPGDPRLGAIGGSYGGGFQLLGAFEEQRHHGTPVFDALAPEVTWHDFSQSLAPDGVVRSLWAAALAASGRASDALNVNVDEALERSAETGVEADGRPVADEDLVTYFHRGSPRWQLQHGRPLDVPMLIGQGVDDSLIPLEQGLQNFSTVMTPAARRHSMLIGYYGGHVLTALTPQRTPGHWVTDDPCSRALGSPDFRSLEVRFFQARLLGLDEHLTGYGEYHLATAAHTCTVVRSVVANTAVEVAPVRSTPTGPAATLVARGPIRIAGTPYLTGRVSTSGLDSRTFLALAVGTSPSDATPVQGDVLPFTSHRPLEGIRHRIELPSVAVDVPAGESLYVLTSPQDTVFATATAPGRVSVQDAVVHLPVVRS